MHYGVEVTDSLREKLGKWPLPGALVAEFLDCLRHQLSCTLAREIGHEVVAPVRYVVLVHTHEWGPDQYKFVTWVNDRRSPSTQYLVDASYSKILAE